MVKLGINVSDMKFFKERKEVIMANLTQLRESVNTCGINVTLSFKLVGEPSIESLVAQKGERTLPLCPKEHLVHLTPGTPGYIGLLNLIAGFVNQN